MNQEVKTFIETLLARMGLAATVVDSVAGGHAVYTISTADSKLLIGHQGETLRAFNLIVRRAFEHKLSEDELHFKIDVNGYYAARDSKVAEEARLLAERARMFKYDVDMRPLNPYERMIVHETIKDIPDVVSESRGEGINRHVVICYRPNKMPLETTSESAATNT